MQPGARSALLLLVAAVLAACATPPAPVPAPPPTPAPALAEAYAPPVERHPVDTLGFFGIEPAMTVVEVWPDADGAFTELLAPLVAEHGKLYLAPIAAQPGNPYVTRKLATFAEKLAARPEIYGKVEVTAFRPGTDALAPPASADVVVTFLDLHNWMSLQMAPEAFQAMHQALKPGGILGVVDHRADPAKPRDPRAANGYVNEDYAIELATAAGFELVARSELNGNLKDTKDHPQGVWSLPPDYRLGKRDREKYEEIGESDRLTLKFRKRSDPAP